MGWVFALMEGELSENSFNYITIKGLPILLIKKEGRVYAIKNMCAHMGCPLSGGELSGYTLKCPCHDWNYDIRTGGFIDAPEIKLATYETKNEDGKILLKTEE